MAGFRRGGRWSVEIVLVLLLAHAVAYLAHEYAHSVTAWALGWMCAPFAIDYGPFSLGNVILLSEVADNVDYAPIFANGHGREAAAIALAGPFIGNGLLYGFSIWVLRRGRPLRVRSFAFCLALMCAGNLWSYVPIRSLTDHADMAIAARGLGIGGWALLPFTLVPTMMIAAHFFRLCGAWFGALSQGSATRFMLLCAVTSYWFFAFFGQAGQDGSYGPVSQGLSLISVYFLFPLGVAALWNGRDKASEGRPIM